MNVPLELMTIDALKRAVPHRAKNTITDTLVEYINDLIAVHPDEDIRDNLLSYSSVLENSKFKIKDYINAVRYVSFKVTGETNIQSYVKTFPERYQRFINNKVSDRDISSRVTSYNKTPLVNLILAQTLVPSYVLNADMYQKALNVSADLMMHARSEKVRCDAANNVMNQLKVPEAVKVRLDVAVEDNGIIEELKQSTLALVQQQKILLESGAVDAKVIAHSKIVNLDEAEEGEFE